MLFRSAVDSGNTTPRKGETITLPAGLGKVNTFMGWQMITAKSSPQYKLRAQAGQNFDNNGYGKINGRYTVATTSTFGKIGDYLDINRADGSTLKAIIADEKRQTDKNANKWGHDQGQVVVEFVVDKDKWYRKSNGKQMDGHSIMKSTTPGKNKNSVLSITNQGSYFQGGSGNGNATLSRRDRYRLNKAKKTSRGGRGTVDYSSVNNIQSNTSRTQHAIANNVQKLITVTKDNTINSLVMNAIEILATIAGNTSDTSNKLNALNRLQNLNVTGGNNTNVIVNSDGSKAISTTSNKNMSDIKNQNIAKQIARGGY